MISRGCFGVGNRRSPDFLGGTRATQEKILSLINADGSGNINVTVNEIPPLGPVSAGPESQFGFQIP